MVNHVVPRTELEAFTLALAEKIGQRPSMGLKLAKMSVNQSLDAQGMWSAVQSAFGLHHLGHTHALAVHGIRVDPDGARMIREGARAKSDAGPAE
jgi:enoyl-CoA hydratase